MAALLCYFVYLCLFAAADGAVLKTYLVVNTVAVHEGSERADTLKRGFFFAVWTRTPLLKGVRYFWKFCLGYYRCPYTFNALALKVERFGQER